MMSLGGGTASFGLLRNADFYLGTNLAKNFHNLYPDVRIRLVGQNCSGLMIPDTHLGENIVSAS
ncbi:hypothetical protein ALO72_200247 [Pseudomonas syringae pv. delphinii]|nr:hypothetical protein ALO72_200247 [Pseudomonas syringae pv. delphinii]